MEQEKKIARGRTDYYLLCPDCRSRGKDGHVSTSDMCEDCLISVYRYHEFMERFLR